MTTANYIAAWHDKYRNKIIAWESIGSPRQRVRREIPTDFYFYVPDRLGDFTGPRGEKLKKLSFTSQDDLDKELNSHSIKFESDFTPLERAFQDIYVNREPPELVVGFLDIEVDYDPDIGFAGPKNPYAPINALTMFTSRGDVLTYALPPKSWLIGTNISELRQAVNAEPGLEHVQLFLTEEELLRQFLDDLQQVDAISGWNSEFFDLPYIVKRIELLLGEAALQLLSFEGGPKLRWSEKPRFKHSLEKEPVVDLVTRPHLDYMALFKKFNLKTRQSFSLSAVALEELDEDKLEYEGTLSELYEQDFIRFLLYNVHDARLLVKFEAKFKYIELANRMVHEATVNFKDIFGSVHIIDSAITNYAHTKLNIRVNDRVSRPDGDPVEGAIVMTPVPGFYEWIGAVDINSLYPNTIRSLNLSPEKIIGQLLGHEADWSAFYAGMKGDQEALAKKVMAQIDGEPEPIELEIASLIDLCKTEKFAVSGFGTILDQKSVGILPSILGYWFNGRKEMQAEKKRYATIAEALLKEGREKTDSEYLEAKRLEGLFDLQQGVRKVQLNSLYGALLNAYMRFGDPRLGASTTFSGRQITTHMVNTTTDFLGTDAKLKKTTTEIIKKKRDGTVDRKVENEYHLDLMNNPGVIYGDTDSAYFTMNGLVFTDADAIEMANAVADGINASFPSFMQTAFNCQPGFETLIKANRELVCRAGILQAKKKYMMLVVDKEGKAIKEDSEDRLKTMGSDIKLSSTPAPIKAMLKNVVMAILNQRPRKEIDDIIMQFRNDMKAGAGLNLDVLDLATVNSVSKLEKYNLLHARKMETGMKATIPAGANAAINYNTVLKNLKIHDAKEITSGDKIKIVWLTPNPEGFKNMAFPSDTETIPEWFTAHYEVDRKQMEQKLVDQKLQNIFEALDWEVPTLQTVLTNSLLDF